MLFLLFMILTIWSPTITADNGYKLTKDYLNNNKMDAREMIVFII